MPDQEPGDGLSRRTLLSATAFTAILTSIAAASTPAALAAEQRYSTAPPTSAVGVIQYGRTYLGQGLASIRPQTTGSWASYPDAHWCAWFISWIIRGLGHGYQPNATTLRGLFPTFYSPQVGDLVAIPGSPPYHVGIVTQVVGGIKIMDGNGEREGHVAPMGTIVMEGARSWGTATAAYSRPNYSGSAPYSGGAEMNLVRIIFDVGPNSASGFASSAIYNPTIGWIQTSTNYGPRDALDGYTAIATELGFTVTEKHVDANGWTLSQLFKFPGTRP